LWIVSIVFGGWSDITIQQQQKKRKNISALMEKKLCFQSKWIAEQLAPLRATQEEGGFDSLRSRYSSEN
jgi:hypothetical protein